MKIIIADDERLIRYYTQSLIAELMNEPYQIFEAANGKAFLDSCIKHSPDIAFVDIKMPYLDGISAIEEARASCPNTTFVVLTAYADFSYAKRCIQLGVTEYILKPIEREALEQVLNKLKRNINKKVSFDNLKFQHKVISLFNNPSFKKANKTAEEQIDEAHSNYFEFFIQCRNYDEMYHSIYSKLSTELSDFAENMVRSGNESVLFHSKAGNLALVIQNVKENQSYIIHSINMILNAYNLNSSCSISCLSTNASNLILLYENVEMINQRYCCIFANKTGTVLDIQTETAFLQHVDFVFLELISKIISAYLDGNEPEYTIHIKKVLLNTPFNQLHISFDRLQHYVNKIMGLSLKEQNPKQFFKALLVLGDNLKINVNQTSFDKIDSIKKYIDQNYMKDISIASVAEIYNLTPNYVSKLFHEKIGTKFTDYLTQIRIYNAKILLSSNNDISIKEVSSMVGYNSPRYFTNIFYKLVNVYPSDYKKSLNRSNG